jgi:hypothetical protein
MPVSDRKLSDFYGQIEILVQDNEGALAQFLIKQQGAADAEAQDAVFESALGRALETYTADRPRQDGSMHTITEAGTTIQEGDFYAVCKLAAGELCGDLSRFFTHGGEGTMLNTSMTSFRTLGDQFASREKVLKAEYMTHIGKSATGASDTRYVTQPSSTRGEEIASRLAPDSGRKAKIRMPGGGGYWP